MVTDVITRQNPVWESLSIKNIADLKWMERDFNMKWDLPGGWGLPGLRELQKKYNDFIFNY